MTSTLIQSLITMCILKTMHIATTPTHASSLIQFVIHTLNNKFPRQTCSNHCSWKSCNYSQYRSILEISESESLGSCLTNFLSSSISLRICQWPISSELITTLQCLHKNLLLCYAKTMIVCTYNNNMLFLGWPSPHWVRIKEKVITNHTQLNMAIAFSSYHG